MPRISALQSNTRAAAKDELASVDVDTQSTKKVTVDMIMPTGSILDYAGSAAPNGWLLCYGQTLNAETNPEYMDLYNAIGNTYGGSSYQDFVVPDLRGRVSAGPDAMGGTAANRLTTASIGAAALLGAAGGAQTHTLTTAQLPSHTHGFSEGREMPAVSAGTNMYVANVASGSSFPTIRVDGSGTTITEPNATAAAGSGNAHNNVQPTLILNKIIKY